MPKPKLLFLTVVKTSLTDKGVNRIKKLTKQEQQNFDDDEDNPKEGSRAWYKNLGVAYPGDESDEEEIENEIDLDGNVKLEEDEYEYTYNECILERDEFIMAVDNEEFGSTVYLMNGNYLDVSENSDDIYAQIYLLEQTWIERLVSKIKQKFNN